MLHHCVAQLGHCRRDCISVVHARELFPLLAIWSIAFQTSTRSEFSWPRGLRYAAIHLSPSSHRQDIHSSRVGMICPLLPVWLLVLETLSGDPAGIQRRCLVRLLRHVALLVQRFVGGVDPRVLGLLRSVHGNAAGLSICWMRVTCVG